MLRICWPPIDTHTLAIYRKISISTLFSTLGFKITVLFISVDDGDMYAGLIALDLIQFVSSLGNSHSVFHPAGSSMGSNVDCSLQVQVFWQISNGMFGFTFQWYSRRIDSKYILWNVALSRVAKIDLVAQYKDYSNLVSRLRVKFNQDSL